MLPKPAFDTRLLFICAWLSLGGSGAAIAATPVDGALNLFKKWGAPAKGEQPAKEPNKEGAAKEPAKEADKEASNLPSFLENPLVGGSIVSVLSDGKIDEKDVLYIFLVAVDATAQQEKRTTEARDHLLRSIEELFHAQNLALLTDVLQEKVLAGAVNSQASLTAAEQTKMEEQYLRTPEGGLPKMIEQGRQVQTELQAMQTRVDAALLALKAKRQDLAHQHYNEEIRSMSQKASAHYAILDRYLEVAQRTMLQANEKYHKALSALVFETVKLGGKVVLIKQQVRGPALADPRVQEAFANVIKLAARANELGDAKKILVGNYQEISGTLHSLRPVVARGKGRADDVDKMLTETGAIKAAQKPGTDTTEGAKTGDAADPEVPSRLGQLLAGLKQTSELNKADENDDTQDSFLQRNMEAAEMYLVAYRPAKQRLADAMSRLLYHEMAIGYRLADVSYQAAILLGDTPEQAPSTETMPAFAQASAIKNLDELLSTWSKNVERTRATLSRQAKKAETQDLAKLKKNPMLQPAIDRLTAALKGREEILQSVQQELDATFAAIKPPQEKLLRWKKVLDETRSITKRLGTPILPERQNATLNSLKTLYNQVDQESDLLKLLLGRQATYAGYLAGLRSTLETSVPAIATLSARGGLRNDLPAESAPPAIQNWKDDYEKWSQGSPAEIATVESQQVEDFLRKANAGIVRREELLQKVQDTRDRAEKSLAQSTRFLSEAHAALLETAGRIKSHQQEGKLDDATIAIVDGSWKKAAPAPADMVAACRAFETIEKSYSQLNELLDDNRNRLEKAKKDKIKPWEVMAYSVGLSIARCEALLGTADTIGRQLGTHLKAYDEAIVRLQNQVPLANLATYTVKSYGEEFAVEALNKTREDVARQHTVVSREAGQAEAFNKGKAERYGKVELLRPRLSEMLINLKKMESFLVTNSPVDLTATTATARDNALKIPAFDAL